ncbi:hypothetical protein F2Q65_04115 [Thiohalocapsa marina]|uniref:Uncharacterized protein n=1 Tax=Thiohalocapsa marina TaxID=424902 RepID=A0A5M8FP72_9GAMM|nr:DUF6489 family protein [Thiohalocapsa marina]KAA6186569.1 hypothetical protein F2Q65_04115 [Thiohalocapsa marina]
MNIRIDIDITPDEMRKLMGLPDVEAFQRQLMDDIRERMNQGVEGYDPLKLFQPYLSSSLAGMEMIQKLMTAGLGGGAKKSAGD